ncbi:thioredoxin domain-containing protein [Candidatus Dojkabacteria bacterium]|uniref:Thioredoxin domain-containing protein n=1 Tax=Candidatus Dojkabacteria bacterium TaxID=2099670 RepID=A0A955L0T3_9BACT|nr:thioredoxin domain-containing protein [Candidatus Dojkabacteria bacterium]
MAKEKIESAVVKTPKKNKKPASSKVLINAGSILLGGVLISIVIFFSGNGISLDSKDDGETTAEVAGECTGENRFGDACYDQYAQSLDLDLEKFQECVEGEKYFDVIDKELSAGETYGVQGTPSFYIGKGKGDEFDGFYVGGIRVQELETLVGKLESEDIASVNKYWTDYLKNSLKEYEPQVREYYASAEGGALTGEALDSAVTTYINEQTTNVNTEYVVQKLSVGDGLTQGDGEIVMMEFSDYECPYCQSFANDILVEAKEKFVDTGKARYIYRDFPLESIHPNARFASNAARCAGDQGKYFEYHDKLFEIN